MKVILCGSVISLQLFYLSCIPLLLAIHLLEQCATQVAVKCTLVHEEVTPDQLPVVMHVYDGVTPPVGVYPLLHVKYVTHPIRVCGSG